MEPVEVDGLTQGEDQDPTLTGMNNLAGMANLNTVAFDQSMRLNDT